MLPFFAILGYVITGIIVLIVLAGLIWAAVMDGRDQESRENGKTKP